jgi:hypothetical protein
MESGTIGGQPLDLYKRLVDMFWKRAKELGSLDIDDEKLDNLRESLAKIWNQSLNDLEKETARKYSSDFSLDI